MLANAGALDECYIRIAISRPAHRIARAVPERELRRHDERRRVEELRRAALGTGELRIGYAIRALRAEPAKGIEVRRLSHRQRQARLHRHHSGKLPTPDYSSNETGRVERPPLSKRQLISKAGDEHIRNVAARHVPFKLAIEAVRNREVCDRPCQYRRVKD